MALWDYSASEPLRAALPPGYLEQVQSLPSVVSLHGWTLRSSFTVPWSGLLASQLPNPGHQATM